jgi:hypothetical protein
MLEGAVAKVDVGRIRGESGCWKEPWRKWMLEGSVAKVDVGRSRGENERTCTLPSPNRRRRHSPR